MFLILFVFECRWNYQFCYRNRYIVYKKDTIDLAGAVVLRGVGIRRTPSYCSLMGQQLDNSAGITFYVFCYESHRLLSRKEDILAHRCRERESAAGADSLCLF